jgi:hypothetical protein
MVVGAVKRQAGYDALVKAMGMQPLLAVVGG